MNEIKIPKHLGIILDGNGRWAQAKGLNRSMGHKEGLKTLEKLIPYIYKQGVSIISIYVFSTENFKRPKNEVDYLMYLFSSKFKHLEKICQENDIRILFSGRKENLAEDVLHIEEELMEHTKNNVQGVLNICLNYGGLSEIVDMVKHLTQEEINTLNEQNIYQYLYQDLPPLDLLIRTGGGISFK